jgi:hypothetical protein
VRAWWISWYADPADGPFELHTPWWISGSTMEHVQRSTIVAAVQAESEDDAWEVVREAYDADPKNLEERFCTELTDEKMPWERPGSRFQLADWMKWPA